MLKRLFAVLACLPLLTACAGRTTCCEVGSAPAEAAPAKAARVNNVWYEPEIAAFEAADAVSPPAPGQVLFVGSSSIRMWGSVHEDMAPLPVLQRGFGGAKTREVLAVEDRVVFPYEPSVIVYYCGDNDLGTWNTDATLAAYGFIHFTETVRDRLPEARVLYLPIKPSIARWSNWDAMARSNEIVRAYCEANDHFEYVDLVPAVLGPDGTPDASLFRDDGLHLNAKGYARWTEVLRPRVLAAWRQTHDGRSP